MGIFGWAKRTKPRAASKNRRPNAAGILLVTHHLIDVDDLARKIGEPDVALYATTGETGIRAVLENEKVDFVCIGGGIDDDERGRLCAVIMSIRDDLHIHLKDRASGPNGMTTFVKALINGFVTPSR